MKKRLLNPKGQEKQSQGSNKLEGSWNEDSMRNQRGIIILTCFGGQIKDKDAEEGDENRRQDEVDGVEEGLPADRNVKRDVSFSCLAVCSVIYVEEGRGLHDIPGT